MKPLRKSLLAIFALVAAFYLSISYQFGDPGWELAVETQQARARADFKSDYDLASLSVLNRVVILIKENYVDPARINERKMIAGAMEEVQKTVAELLVDSEIDPGDNPTRVTVSVGGSSETFDLTDVDNLWQMSFKFKDIFRFIQRNLKHFDEYRDIEYAAIDGMLSTLDPHSVLLRPEDYREMKLSTRGKFGGLGIVISVRDGQLTIINPIPDTPAARAGLRAGDRIVQINYDSTMNMALNDAVNMLRGAPNTKVDIWVVREGWKKPRKFTLTRANIKIKSVASKLLPGRVGLVRVRNFQNTTHSEIRQSLSALKKKARGLKGLIIDLRDNPGGLLDQAIKVSDMFVESGPIVTTVGVGDKLREPKMATRSTTEEDFPLIVLTDVSSASASEIVAGALKNHRRALVVGQQTFGKGSVQVIYDNKDDSALKLTIAQYLTPGDISIQSVGIAPDIATRPVILDEKSTDFFRSEEFKGGEKDLPAHLEHESSKISRAQKPTHTVKYLRDPELQKQIEENPNDLIVDFEISLARELLVNANKTRSDRMLTEVEPALQRRIREENSKIVEALAARGVDWTASVSTTGAPVAEVALTTGAVDDNVVAGDSIVFEATVKNTGEVPFDRLRALTYSDNNLFEGMEFLFGSVPPGESRTWKVPLDVPRSALTRRDSVRLEFQEAGGHAPDDTSRMVGIRALARPRFAVTFRIDDRSQGNGDGLLQPGESADLVVDVNNVGDGKSFTTLAALRNADDDDNTRGLFVERGRVHADDLAAGDRKSVSFSFRVKPDVRVEALPVSVSVMDTEVREITSEKFMLRIDLPGDENLEPIAGEAYIARAQGGSVALRGIHDESAPLAATADGAVRVDGRFGEWYRVPTDDGLYLWADARAVQIVDKPASIAALIAAIPNGPPVIRLNGDRPGVETKSAAITLSGEASGRVQLKDLFIFVNNKKIFFKSNESGPSGKDQNRLEFMATVPLEEGVNRITVVAREDKDLSSRQTLIVRRDPLSDAEKSAALGTGR